MKLSWPIRILILVAFGLLLMTGIFWMIAQAEQGQPDWEHIPALLMKIHGAAAMAALFLLGLLMDHISKGWRSRKNRISGLILLGFILFLVATGYGLYYAGDEELRIIISRYHTWIGLSIGLLMPLHIVLGRFFTKSKKKQTQKTRPVIPPAQYSSRR